MTIQSALFDIDGTLIDSVDLHAQAWKDAFEEYGHKVDFKELRAQIGKGADQLMPVFLSEKEVKDISDALHERRSAIFQERYLDRVKGFPNVRALFERLLADGKTIALASSCKAEELDRYKEIAGIDGMKLAETTSDDVDASKPNPDIFQAALDRLKIDPAEAVVIGDTPYDAEAAKRAGIRAIGVLCGGWTEAELRQAGCAAIYRDPTDLLQQYPAWISAS